MKTPHQRMPWLDQPWRQFLGAIAADRLGHAYLVQAPAGSGKRHLSAAMQARLLCLAPTSEGACGQCRSCQLLRGGAHPDLRRVTFELTDKGKLRTEIIVDQVRRLSESLRLRSSVSAGMVAEVYPAEAMNRHAANALLKTLEEPQPGAVLVLVSHDPRRLPATIVSRCQALTVVPPGREALAAWVADEAGVETGTAAIALEASGHSPLLALDLVTSDDIEHIAAIQRQLGELWRRPRTAVGVAQEWRDHDAAQLWTWLSGASAAAVRGMLTGQPPAWLNAPLPADARPLFELQQRADRNRRLAPTTVRQDFLVQEWLLDWSSLGHGGST